jgi:molybdenum cofactor cytidylyltransferase
VKHAILVLAAGRSSRFEQGHKLLEPFRGKPLLAATLASLAGAGAEARIAVIGARAEETRALAEQAGFTPVFNPDFATGLASSIRAGLGAVPPECDAVLLHLGDMPLVKPQTIQALFDTARGMPESVAFVPAYSGEWGNPVLIRRVLFPNLTALAGDKGAKGLLLARTDLRVVPVDDPGILVDLDTRAAFSHHAGEAE